MSSENNDIQDNKEEMESQAEVESAEVDTADVEIDELSEFLKMKSYHFYKNQKYFCYVQKKMLFGL